VDQFLYRSGLTLQSLEIDKWKFFGNILLHMRAFNEFALEDDDFYLTFADFITNSVKMRTLQ